MKDRQLCQSEAEARLSARSAIAVPAIAISLKSSLSTARLHRREDPQAVVAMLGISVRLWLGVMADLGLEASAVLSAVAVLIILAGLQVVLPKPTASHGDDYER
ncbi:hypothetical protein [Paracoccus hibiscisoli]|uniref:Uncharacterized protein n=1 Tax=Paracoccus hibiscisoli TaxID=2023261 RepID=A0A4U0QA45_9RHOB|nr:hypothetical protein [Paracoccus hibiscisoli]TJZ78209.1 hypothetical protein FA740_18515 [Paracoccus hibiscisoli]